MDDAYVCVILILLEIIYFFFLVLFEGFKKGVFPGVDLLSLCLLSGFPVDLAFLFGPGFSPIIILFEVF